MYTDEDIKFIRNNIKLMSCADIGRRLGHPTQGIYGKAKRLGLNIPRQSSVTPTQAELMKKAYNMRWKDRLKYREIAELIGVNYGTIWAWCNKKGKNNH